jgi:hypothetical protein
MGYWHPVVAPLFKRDQVSGSLYSCQASYLNPPPGEHMNGYGSTIPSIRADKMAASDTKRRREEMLRKRSRTLLKKIHELCKLCNIKAVLIIYDPIRSRYRIRRSPGEPSWLPSMKQIASMPLLYMIYCSNC